MYRSSKRSILALFAAVVWVLPMATAPATPAEPPPLSLLCVDAETGLVLYESHADLRRPPASMLKMMMMLLVAEGLDSGQLRADTPVTVSGHAASMGGTQVFLKAGDAWPLARMMRAIAVASANDGAMAVAESVWGSEGNYLKVMNRRAQELGMLDTVFHSVHGLPPDDRKTFDQTTARDMALLARACVRHPIILEWTSQREFRAAPGGPILKHNTNKLLWRMEDCDGLKTGFIRKAGFCVTATAKRGGIRLIAVVMGASQKYRRFEMAQQLLEDGFKNISRQRPVTAGAFVGSPAPVAHGELDTVRLTAAEDIWLHLTPDMMERIRVTHEIHGGELEAPLQAGQVVGEVLVRLDGKVVARCGLTTPVDVERAGWRLVLRQGAVQWEGLDSAIHAD